MKVVVRYLLLIVALSLVGCSAGTGAGAEPVEMNSVGPLNTPTDSPVDQAPINENISDVTGPHDQGIEGSGQTTLPDDGEELMVTAPGQGTLGPIVDADVKIYDVANLTTPVCTTKTKDNTDLKKAGSFDVPENCIYKNTLYLVVITGGFDVDIDDDGIRNKEDEDDDYYEKGTLDPKLPFYSEAKGKQIQVDGPLKVDGTFRALVYGEQMQEPGWKVSSLTEFIFESVQYQVGNADNLAEFIESLDSLAKLVLKRDINADGDIDKIDLILWNPDIHGSEYLDGFILQLLVREIHTGKNTTVDTTYWYKNLVKHVNTLNPAQSVKVKDQVAYVASHNALILIDVSQVKAAHIIGWFPTAVIQEFVIGENYAFIALQNGTLQVVDISNPQKPKLVNSFEQWAEENTVRGSFFFIYEGENFRLNGDELYFMSYKGEGGSNETLNMPSLNCITPIDNFSARHQQAISGGKDVYPPGVLYEAGPAQLYRIAILENELYAFFGDKWYDTKVENGCSMGIIKEASIDSTPQIRPVYLNAYKNKLYMIGSNDFLYSWNKNEGLLKSAVTVGGKDTSQLDYNNVVFVDDVVMIPSFHLEASPNPYLNSYSNEIRQFRFFDVSTLDSFYSYMGPKEDFINSAESNGPVPLQGLAYQIAENSWTSKIGLPNTFWLYPLVAVQVGIQEDIYHLNNFQRSSLTGYAKLPQGTGFDGNYLYVPLKNHGLHIVSLPNLYTATENVPVVPDEPETPIEIIEPDPEPEPIVPEEEVSPEEELGDPALGKVTLNNVSVLSEGNDISNEYVAALHGGLMAAKIHVYEINNTQGESLCSVVSQGNVAKPAIAGNIRLPKGCIKPKGIYLVTSEGGKDLDANDDGVNDKLFTNINGTLSAVLTTEQLYNAGWQLNPYSELLFRRVNERLNGEFTAQTILDELKLESTSLTKNEKENLNWLRAEITAGDSITTLP